ncbi:hypothetical protein MKW94_010083 [Papaver nudicaule]|uniref:Uncharacterized protein n=1 Tax=Papaver nudicaule TaxID=74823 RepID=A0AA42AWX8_PAPNU|nr:hypothetical protein [Papaver nudicaule]
MHTLFGWNTSLHEVRLLLIHSKSMEKLEENNRLKADERVPWLLKLHSSVGGAGPPSKCCIARLWISCYSSKTGNRTLLVIHIEFM